MDTLTTSKPRTLESKPIAPSLFAHFVLRSSNMASDDRLVLLPCSTCTSCSATTSSAS